MAPAIPPAEREAAPFRRRYRLLDVPVVLATDRQAVLAGFDRVYRRFRSPGLPRRSRATPGYAGAPPERGRASLDASDPGQRADRGPGERASPRGQGPDRESLSAPDRLCLTILVDGNGGDRPLLISPAGRLRLATQDVSPSLYLHVLSHVYLRSAWPVFHAAAAARGGRGLMVCAPSGTGKTTLVLDLVHRGWEFLSDELAPIGPGGLIEPFPRALGLREETLALHPWVGGTRGAIGRNSKGEFKDFRDLGLLPGVRIGRAVPPRWVVFLDPPPEAATADKRRYLELGFAARIAQMLPRLAGLPGVLAVEPLEDRHYPTLRLTLVEGIDVGEPVERVAASLGAPIVSTRWGRTAPPDFEASPVLTRLRGSEGLLEWQRHLLNARPPARLLADHGGSSSRLLLALAGFAGGLRFYRMTLGRLRGMSELLESVCVEA